MSVFGFLGPGFVPGIYDPRLCSAAPAISTLTSVVLATELHRRVIADRVRAEIAKAAGRDIAPPDATLLVDLPGVDSLGLIDLALDLEEAFVIEIDDDRWAEARTVGGVIAAVREALKEKR